MINLEKDKIPSEKEVDTLKSAISLLENANKKTIDFYAGKDKFGITMVINTIKSCKSKYAQKGFPVNSLKYVVKDLHWALAGLEVHKIHKFREEIEEILAPWTAQQKEQSHP